MNYRVVLTGTLDQGTKPKAAAISLAHTFKRRPNEIEALLCGRRKVVKQGLTQEAATRFQRVFVQAGVHANVEPESEPSTSPHRGDNDTDTESKSNGNPPTDTPLSTEQYLEQAQVRLRRKRCPKCGAALHPESGGFDPDQACPHCDTYPRKYLGMLEKKREHEERDRRRQQILEQPSAARRRGLAEYLPSGALVGARWVFAAIGLLLLIGGGYSVFDQPRYELLYDPEQPIVQCPNVAAGATPEAIAAALSRMGMIEQAQQCMETGVCKPLCKASYALFIGNTGRRTQAQTVVRLDQSLIARAHVKPLFLNYDRVNRKVYRRDRDGVTSYALGPLKPTEQVVMHASLLVEDRADAPTWDEFLRGIDTASGEVHEGPPLLSLVTRIFLRAFSAFSPSDAIEAASDLFLDGDPVQDIAAWASEQQPAKPEGIALKLSHSAPGFGNTGPRAYYDHSITIRNRGAQEARDVQATVHLAKGFKLIDAERMVEIEGGAHHAIVFMGLEQRGSRTPCRQSGNTLSCNIGKVRNADIVTLFLRLSPSPKLRRGPQEQNTRARRFRHSIELSIDGEPLATLEFDDRL